MEEWVGQLWDRAITRIAGREHADAAVALEDVAAACGIWFRAFGGDPGLAVEPAAVHRHAGPRGWLERIAGTGDRVDLAYADARALRLPGRVALFPHRALNRDLYLWLSALTAAEVPGGEWVSAAQARVEAVLRRFPGLEPCYRRLVDGYLPLRPDPCALPDADAAVERAIRGALVAPGSVAALPGGGRRPVPVALWLHPEPPVPPERAGGGGAGAEAARRGTAAARRRRHQVETVRHDEGRAPFMLFRADAVFTWAEMVRVNRATDDDEDPDAARIADAVDRLSVAPDGDTVAGRLRIDLDLDGGDTDTDPLGGEHLLPEWDHRSRRLRPAHCRVRVETPPASGGQELPPHLRRLARRVRARFERLAPARRWERRQADGPELDLDAIIDHRAALAAGHGRTESRLFRSVRPGHRDLACLLLADLSLSTDAWVDDHARVIDVIRDSLLLFGEALAATGDRFAIQGFSSRRRHDVRIHTLKAFDARYDGGARGRIQAIRPGFYTRLGAAIRFATLTLSEETASQRLLLVLTDGKPNDQDAYDGRYGIEDTRVAVVEARRAGLHPFCVTIDERANDYLPHLFGRGGFVLVRRPADLPRELPRLYARLTG
ncbi:MAG: nitric oxide reductase [Ectothiorhodospiraceae bacterium]|nr:nitric oxide reductase [Chromatiales bacterium]MCP5154103.1 nitric oxide reductase [Ectothiorhodospiraceae bacterium]